MRLSKQDNIVPVRMVFQLCLRERFARKVAAMMCSLTIQSSHWPEARDGMV